MDLLSKKKELNVTIQNSGSTDKTYNVLSGSTDVETVEDNVEIPDPFLISEVDSTTTLFSSGSNGPFASCIDPVNRRYFYKNPNSTEVIVYNLDTNTVESVLNDASFGTGNSGPCLVYYAGNGVVIVVDTQAKNINFIDSSLGITTLNIAGVGVLRFGSVDFVNNKFYTVNPANNLFYKIDIASETLESTLNLSAQSVGLSFEYCEVGTILIAILGTGVSNVVFVDINSFTYFNSVSCAAGSLSFVKYANGVFCIANSSNNYFTINESTLSISSIYNIGSTYLNRFFGLDVKDNRYVYGYGIDYAADLIKVVQIDTLDSSFSNIVVNSEFQPGADINNGILYNDSNGLLYMSKSNTLIAIDYELNHASSYLLSLINPEQNRFVCNGSLLYDSDSTDLIYASIDFSNDIVRLTQQEAFVPVTVTVNGGVTSVSELNQFLTFNPIKVLNMKIVSSCKSSILSAYNKVRVKPTGSIDSRNIAVNSKFTAYNDQFIIELTGKDLNDPVFDAQTYFEGIISAGCTVSILIQYLEYSPNKIVNGGPTIAEPIRKEKKKKTYYRKIWKLL